MTPTRRPQRSRGPARVLTLARATGLTLIAVCGIGLTACGNSQDDAVGAAVETFYEAVAAGEGARACAALGQATRSELEQSSGEPCAEAVLSEDVPDVAGPERVDVFGTMAQVRYDGEVAFLTRFEHGWRVVAAVCTPARDHYDCSIKGA